MGMKIRVLTDMYAVSPQLRPADVEAAAAQGYKVIINNRPDGEGWGQPKGAAIEAEAEAHGLGYYHIPISNRGLQPGQIEELTRIQQSTEGPILAFCLAGGRSAMVWALSQAGKMDADSIIRTAANAGYDVSNLKPHLG